MFEPKRFYRKLETLFHAVDIAGPGDRLLRTVLHDVVTVLGDELRISRGVVFALHEGHYEAVDSAGAELPGRIPSSDPGLALVLRHGTFIFDEGHSPTPIPDWPGASLGIALKSEATCVMLFGLRDGWIREQLEFAFNTLRNYINQRLESERLRHDLLEARVVQTSLLPKAPPALRGYAFAARSVPAEVVGGDFYDWIDLSKDSAVVAIGDASGHGIPAALQVRDVVTGLRMGVGMEFRLSNIVSRLNQVVNASDLATRFVSMFIGELEVNGDVLYVNAGHVPPLVVRARGIEVLKPTGMVLGPTRDAHYGRGHVHLNPNDILVLYTDGITERADADDRQFGDERFRAILRKGRAEHPEHVLREVFDAAEKHGAGPWKDDATLVILKRLPSEAREG